MREKKYEVGDLVEVFISEFVTDIINGYHEKECKERGIILWGSPVSLYVEDRPVRSISTVQYSIMIDGKRKTIYEEQISGKLN
jgi:hypothetical protein